MPRALPPIMGMGTGIPPALTAIIDGSIRIISIMVYGAARRAQVSFCMLCSLLVAMSEEWFLQGTST